MSDHKTIGLIGGLSPESTVHYYSRICRNYNQAMGKLNFPRIILESVNLQVFTECFARNDWDQVGEMLLAALARLKGAGADFAAILANTPHHAWEQIAERTPLKVLTIMEATADALKKDQLKNVLLLGTRATMESGFFQHYFEGVGITSTMPNEKDRQELDRIVWEELSHGNVLESSRSFARTMIATLIEGGAEAVVLACTELEMLIQQEDSSKPLYDTMRIHADAILEYAISAV
ncbi:MAG: amino acid racemase [Kiritimatiellae bacterium]|nr:amino acid racemase [Kiritimatiellia bacterium]